MSVCVHLCVCTCVCVCVCVYVQWPGFSSEGFVFMFMYSVSVWNEHSSTMTMISNNEFNQKFVVFTSVISFIVAAVCIPANPHTFAAPGFAQQAISAAPRLDPCRH